MLVIPRTTLRLCQMLPLGSPILKIRLKEMLMALMDKQRPKMMTMKISQSLPKGKALSVPLPS